MKKAIVIGRNYTSRLGAIRALGRIGFEVCVIYTNRTKDPDRFSKYVKQYIPAREPQKDILLNAILSLKGNQKCILIPTDDYSAAVIDENIDTLKEYFYFQNIKMTPGEVFTLMQKDKQKDIAKACGLHTPDAKLIEIKDGSFNIPANITYPCFTKPTCSILGHKKFMKKCNNYKELYDWTTEIAKEKANTSILAEEYIEITNEYATVGFCNGKDVVIPAIFRMILDGKGKHKGVTILGEVLPCYEFQSIVDKFKAFMISTQFVGLFDIDFYESNGDFYFNELNLRMGASGWALVPKGINLYEILTEHLCGKQILFPQATTKKQYLFVNEKGLWEHTCEGHISLLEYIKILNKADIRFVKDPTDLKPFRYFKARNLKYILKKLCK